MNVDDIADPS